MQLDSFFFSSRRRHTRSKRDWSSDVCSSDLQLVEHFVTSDTQQSMIGNIYLGRVQNVLASMEAAFIDIGTGRNAVLYASEVNWQDRKSTRLNSSHVSISYAVFCLKKKTHTPC